MKSMTALLCLCLTGLAHGGLLDIWQTIEKPLEGVGEAFLGAVLKDGISPVLGHFEKRDLSRLAINLKDEVLKWMQDAKAHVEEEMTQIEAAREHPEDDFSDRIRELLHDLDLAMEHGNVERFVTQYREDIFKQFVPILPKLLETKVMSITHQVQRKTRGKDILIQMLKNITIAHWFFTIPEMERQFLVAMLDAAEYGHLHDFVEHHSYDRVLLFIDHLPSAEGHKLNHYLVEHLKIESPHNTTVVHKPAKRDVQEFLAILQEIYSEHIYSLLDKADRIFLLEMMDAAEHGNLTDFIADHGMERVNGFLLVIPKESGDKLSKFIADHITKETEASVSHGSHHHGKRSPDILLTILKDIHTADVFFHLPEAERKFMLELMDVAENDKLDEYVHKVGIQRVRDFISHLPKQYADVMTQYVQNHLHHHMTTPAPTPSTGIMMKILQDIHTAHMFFDLPGHAREMVLTLMDAAANGHLAEKLADIGMEKLQAFIKHIPAPYDHQLTEFITHHLRTEMTTEAPSVQRRQIIGDIHQVLHHLGNHVHEHSSQYSQHVKDFYQQLKHAAENKMLKEFINKVGKDKLYTFLDAIPDMYATTLEQRILKELEEEDKVIPTLTKRASHDHGHNNIHETLTHLGEHLNENHSHYSINIHQFYAELKHAVDSHKLKEFIHKVGTEELYAFLNALSSDFSKNLEIHILQELEKEDNVNTL